MYIYNIYWLPFFFKTTATRSELQTLMPKAKPTEGKGKQPASFFKEMFLPYSPFVNFWETL